MKRPATWGVIGVLAAAGTLGIWPQPGAKRLGGNAVGASQMSLRQAPREASGNTNSENIRACADIVQHLQLFLALDELPEPDSCLGPHPSHAAEKQSRGPVGGQAPSQFALKFVVATLPDPLHTHLPLLFDRMAEVIQEAAQDESYSYEVSWLPWEAEEQTYTQLADEDRAADRKELRENQPGILLFRSTAPPGPSKSCGYTEGSHSDSALRPYREGLVVFVVGEDPTRGIHTVQFTNALAWINELKRLGGNTCGRTAILGPTFSGSFPSLAKLLSSSDSGNYLKEIRGNRSVPLAIYSGTANSGKAIAGFDCDRIRVCVIAHFDQMRMALNIEVGAIHHDARVWVSAKSGRAH